MADWTRDLDQDNMTLTLDLTEIFGEALPDDRLLLEEIGQEFIDIMVERTRDDGVDWQGTAFRPYSKAYFDEGQFTDPEVNAFKDTNRPNLVVREDMLDAIDIIEVSPTQIVLGFDDDFESNKAHGHVTNKNGQWDGRPRDFWGFSPREVDRVKAQYEDQVRTEIDTRLADDVPETTQPTVSELFAEALGRRLGRTRFFRLGEDS